MKIFSGPIEGTMKAEFEGFALRVEVERDQEYHSAPWDEYDGNGIISEWTHRDKAPGERVLVSDRYGGAKRYYDIEGTMKRALEEGWDAPPYGACAGYPVTG